MSVISLCSLWGQGGLPFRDGLLSPAPGGRSPKGEAPVPARHGDLLRLGMWLLGEHQDATDAAADTLALARRLHPQFRRPWQLRIWLYLMMTRRCWQTLRRAPRSRISLFWDGDLVSAASRTSRRGRRGSR